MRGHLTNIIWTCSAEKWKAFPLNQNLFLLPSPLPDILVPTQEMGFLFVKLLTHLLPSHHTHEHRLFATRLTFGHISLG